MRSFAIALGRPSRMPGLRMAVVIVLALAAPASLLTAHDFWLIPDAFAATPGGRLVLQSRSAELFGDADLRFLPSGLAFRPSRDAISATLAGIVVPGVAVDAGASEFRET